MLTSSFGNYIKPELVLLTTYDILWKYKCSICRVASVIT